MGKFALGCTVLLSALLSEGLAFAQAPAEGPAGIPAGPLVVYPGFDMAIGHDDNLFSSELNKRSSDVQIYSPYVRVEGKPGPHKFDVSYRMDIGRFSQSAADNYEDHFLVGNANIVFSGRSDLKLRAEHVYGHDPRGSTDRPAGNSPDEWTNTGAEGILGYGAPGAQGRVELNAGYYQREYQNNRLNTEGSDRDTGILGATFLWRVAPKTQLLFQGERRDIDYKLGASTLDSTEDRLYVGAKWEATALTTGTAKIGRLKKDFDNAGRQDFTGTGWEVGVRWSPLTYSVFDFSTARQPSESTGLGDTTIASTYGVVWTHAWSSRVRSIVLGNWRKDDFKGLGVTREDETATLGFKLHYQFRRWLRFGVEYTHTDRDSNTPTFDYKRNVLFFTLGATL